MARQTKRHQPMALSASIYRSTAGKVYLRLLKHRGKYIGIKENQIFPYEGRPFVWSRLIFLPFSYRKKGVQALVLFAFLKLGRRFLSGGRGIKFGPTHVFPGLQERPSFRPADQKVRLPENDFLIGY